MEDPLCPPAHDVRARLGWVIGAALDRGLPEHTTGSSGAAEAGASVLVSTPASRLQARLT